MEYIYMGINPISQIKSLGLCFPSLNRFAVGQDN